MIHGIFCGTLTLECSDDGATTTVSLDAMCDAAGLGTVLGVAGRQHMQSIPPAARAKEFQRMLAAFVVNAADQEPVKVLSGSAEMVLTPDSSEVPS
jgi:hypothetical protein